MNNFTVTFQHMKIWQQKMALQRVKLKYQTVKQKEHKKAQVIMMLISGGTTTPELVMGFLGFTSMFGTVH